MTSPAYQNLMNVLARTKQANDAIMPGQMAAPGPTPETDPTGQEALAAQRYAITAQNQLGGGAEANPMVAPTTPETINQQMYQEVQQKAAAIEKAAREYAHEQFNELIAEDEMKQASAAFAQLSPADQQVYLEEAQKVAALQEQGFVATEYGWVHQSQFLR